MQRGNFSTGSRVAHAPMRHERWRDTRGGGARRWVAWAALPGALASLAASGCGAAAQCSCPDRAIYLKVPDDRAKSVIDVAPSGAACAGVKPTCIENGASGGCTVYRIGPVNAGGCHVDVDFSTQPARFSADAKVVANGGCCGGFVTDPPSAGDVEVPSAGDAGASVDAASAVDSGAVADAGGGG